MSNITLHANFTPSPAKIWSSDPVFGNGTRHQISAAFADSSGNAVVPAHTYTSATMVVKWHVVAPYQQFWTYNMRLRVDANPSRNPYSLENPAHVWQQPPNSPYAGPGAALEDDYTLPSVWLSFVNAAAGGALTVLLNLDSTVQVPNSTTIVIDSVVLTLSYADAPGSNFAKRWSAALVEGRGICAFVDVSGALQVSTTRSIQGGITAGKSAGWTTPYQLAAHAQDCNVGIHPGKGRGQIWYTQLDNTGSNPASVYITSPTAGGSQDWSSPTTLTPHTYYTATTMPSPYSPRYNSATGLYKYVTSQSTGTGADVGAAGKDGRLCWYPSTQYTISVSGGTLNANGFCCMDDGIGVKWDYRDFTGAGAYNSFDGAPTMSAIDTSTHGTGKIYGSIVGGAYRSAIVQADNDTLYQLVFSTSYSRSAKLVPRAGTPTATANQIQNNVNNNPPTTSTITNNYTLAVPAGTDQIQYVRLNWVPTVRERANVAGTLDSASRPTKVRFDIPALADIPGYDDLGHPTSFYGGASYLYASVVLDFTYINASGLQIAFTHNLTGGMTGQKYPPAQQAKTGVVNGRGEYTGTLAWDYYGNFDIDRARSSTIQFDVIINGTVDTLNIKSIALHIHNAQTEAAMDTLTLASAQSTTTATALNIGFGGYGGEITVQMGSGGVSAPTLLTEINGVRGNNWDFNLTWTQHNTLGPGGSTKLLPFDMLFLDEYAQILYYANQTDSSKGDFFLVRSRDYGKSWEFAGDGKPIAGLSGLRDANNAGIDVKMPALVTENNIVHCVWVESSVVKTASSQDAGETWQSA